MYLWQWNKPFGMSVFSLNYVNHSHVPFVSESHPNVKYVRVKVTTRVIAFP
jgi:hypothetical protein